MKNTSYTRRRVLRGAAWLPVALVPGSNYAQSTSASNEAEPAHAAHAALSAWITAQRGRSIGYLLRNISPKISFVRTVDSVNIAPDRLEVAHREAVRPGSGIRFEGNKFVQEVTALPGSVLAADRGKPEEPDYAFHWVRDSSLIMHEMATLLSRRKPLQPAGLDQRWEEYVSFSKTLQRTPSTVGSGEVRYNLDGTQDYLQWSRPQHDGPPLRALALLHFSPAHGEPESARSLRHAVLERDLDDVAASWNTPGFDLWEEYNAQDFHARVVRLGALQSGAIWARQRGDIERAKHYQAIVEALRGALEQHWLPDQSYYGFHLGPTLYWDGKEKTKPGGNQIGRASCRERVLTDV